MGKPGPGSSVTSPSGTSHSHSNSIDKKPSIPDFRSPTKPSQGQFNTAPPNTTAGDTRYVNEFGERKKSLDIGGTSYVQTIGATGYGSAAGASGSGVERSRAGSGSSYDNHAAPMARPRSSGGRANPAQRLTIVNASEDEIREQIEAEKERARRHPSTILESPISTTPLSQQIPPAKPAAKSGFLTAEQEKVLLYQNAVASVERTQGQVRTGVSAACGYVLCGCSPGCNRDRKMDTETQSLALHRLHPPLQRVAEHKVGGRRRRKRRHGCSKMPNAVLRSHWAQTRRDLPRMRLPRLCRLLLLRVARPLLVAAARPRESRACPLEQPSTQKR